MNYYTGGFSNKKRTLLSSKGVFPTGLYYLVSKFLKDHALEHTIHDHRMPPRHRGKLFTLHLGYNPYPEQVAAGEAAAKHGRGIIVAPTGVGKTAIAALIINKLQVPTLIVVPSLELKRQTIETLSKTFGNEKIGVEKPIRVENIDALPLKPLPGYDCIIIDEFHHSGAKTYRDLNKKAWKDIHHRFGLTATPFRSNSDERLLLEGVLSEVIYEIDYATAVENHYIVPMESYYVEVPRMNPTGYNFAQIYSELVVNNKVRNDLITQIIMSLKHKSTLILVKEIKHGITISTKSNSLFANGEDKDTKDMITFFNQDKIKTLIGTTGVLGEGIDTKPAEYIILAGLGKSKNAFMQQVGRGFRNYPGKDSCKIILFKDNSHKWTIAHFKAQVKYLNEEYGSKPIKLDVDIHKDVVDTDIRKGKK